MRLSAAIDRPSLADVGLTARVTPSQWDEATTVAAAELSRRARPALATYLGLLSLAAWGSGAFHRRSDVELRLLIVTGIGILVTGLARRQLTIRPSGVKSWWRAFGGLTICNAALIGGLGASMTVHHKLGAPALIYWLVLAGAGYGATTSLTPSPVLARVFLWLSLSPLTIAALWMATGVGYAWPGIFATFLAFMSAQAARASRAYWEGIISEVLLRDQAKALDAARLDAQEALATQNRLVAELGAYREDAERDYAVAARIFAGIVERSCFTLGSLKATVAPVDRFNGDLVMAAISGGRLRLFLGDFTGHGLSAAVGALPVAEAFFSGAARGDSVGRVLQEMNALIRRNLPRGMFLTAFIAEIEVGVGRMSYWNGGLPAAFVLGPTGAVVARLASQDVALGVLSPKAFQPAPESIKIELGDRIFAYSDGVIETMNATGELFGDAGLERVLTAGTPTGFLSEAVGLALAQYRHGVQNADDVTLLELRHDETLVAEFAGLVQAAPTLAGDRRSSAPVPT